MEPVAQHIFLPFHSYREVWQGASTEILRSNYMNVLLFYPVGFLFCALLPQTWPRPIRVLLPFVLLACLSGYVEYLQYTYELGRAEADDVIHNALGGLWGSSMAAIRWNFSKVIVLLKKK